MPYENLPDFRKKIKTRNTNLLQFRVKTLTKIISFKLKESVGQLKLPSLVAKKVKRALQVANYCAIKVFHTYNHKDKLNVIKISTSNYHSQEL